MPCDDITESLELHLDLDDRFVSYELIKQTCGRAVGESSLLLDWVKDHSAEEFLQISVDAFLDEFAIEDQTEEFLHLKHFFALQSAIGVLVGNLPGGADEHCKVEQLGFDDRGTELSVVIEINAVTKKIKSCGRCSGCGSKAKKAVSAS